MLRGLSGGMWLSGCDGVMFVYSIPNAVVILAYAGILIGKFTVMRIEL